MAVRSIAGDVLAEIVAMRVPRCHGQVTEMDRRVSMLRDVIPIHVGFQATSRLTAASPSCPAQRRLCLTLTVQSTTVVRSCWFPALRKFRMHLAEMLLCLCFDSRFTLPSLTGCFLLFL